MKRIVERVDIGLDRYDREVITRAAQCAFQIADHQVGSLYYRNMRRWMMLWAVRAFAVEVIRTRGFVAPCAVRIVPEPHEDQQLRLDFGKAKDRQDEINLAKRLGAVRANNIIQLEFSRSGLPAA